MPQKSLAQKEFYDAELIPEEAEQEDPGASVDCTVAGGWMKGRWGGNRERTGVAFSGKLYYSHQMPID